MSRNDVMEAVFKHLKKNVDMLENTPIDPSRSMRELGATSLDVVEIISGVTRELRVRVPRTELSRLSNLNELIDLLYSKSAHAA